VRIVFQATIALLFALSLFSQVSPPHMRERLVPLDTTEPSASADDLAPLDDFVAGARVVALGEATHGAKEFFEVKHRLVRYLIESHGFTVLAIEDNIPEASRVNRYITTGGGTTRGAVSELFGVWNTREFLELVEWLRLHNSISQDQVIFRGFDIQSPGAAANVVLDFLEQVDSDFRFAARELYGPAFEVASDHSTFLSHAPVLLSNSRRVLDHLERRREDYVRSASEDEFEWALTNARTVVQLGQKAYDNMATRDESMAENVLRLLAENSSTRLILWAHNGHVMESRRAGYASDTPMVGSWPRPWATPTAASASSTHVDATAPTIASLSSGWHTSCGWCPPR
jgi:erythromycin esterase